MSGEVVVTSSVSQEGVEISVPDPFEGISATATLDPEETLAVIGNLASCLAASRVQLAVAAERERCANIIAVAVAAAQAAQQWDEMGKMSNLRRLVNDGHVIMTATIQT